MQMEVKPIFHYTQVYICALVCIDSMIMCINWYNLYVTAGVGFASRQIANLAKPSLVFGIDDQGLVTMKSTTTFKTVEIKFRLNEEFDELTADDRQAKVVLRNLRRLWINCFLLCVILISVLFQTVMRLVDGKLIQTQSWEGRSTTIEREVQGGKLILVSRTDCLVWV